MSMDKTDAPAVSLLMGVVASSVGDMVSFFKDCHALDWARSQAETDAKAACSAFHSFLSLSGLPAWSEPPKELVAYWSDLWLSGLFVPLAKYVTACPLAAFSGVSVHGEVEFRELPPRPSWLPEIDPLRALFPMSSTNAFLKPLRTRLRETRADGSPTARSLALAWSFQGIKNMMPAMWVNQVGSSLKDHSTLLSSEPPPLSARARQVLTAVGTSIALGSYAPGTSLSQLPQPKLSSSAGWVKIYDQEAKRFRTMEGTRAAQAQMLGGRVAEELLSMAYHPAVGTREFRGHPYQFRWDDWDFDPKVSVVALQEPFKIRTISIADGPATAAGTPLQKVWHKTLRQLAPFQLIGGRAVAETVAEMFRFEEPSPEDIFGSVRQHFVSGDYSAATDRLSLTASRVVFEALIAPLALPDELRRRLETGLFSAELDYSRTLESFRGKVPDGVLDSVPLPPTTRQTNGQLMGNILSFPILCMVNMAGWILSMLDGPMDHLRLALWRGLKRGYWTLDELNSFPVLINGDDILFKATRDEYVRWREVIGQFGLQLSVGKNFFSDKFFTVNSELYTANGFVTRPWWGGLLTDTVRMRNELKWELGTDVLTGDLRKIVPDIQGLFLSSFPAHRRQAANTVFLETYTPMLAPYKGLNWFIPVELGGMGLESDGRASRVTYAQRKLAVRLSLTDETPKGFSPQGTLSSRANELKLRELLRPVRYRGEIVRDEAGRRYVLNKHQPLAVRLGGKGYGVYYRAHPLVDSVIQSSSLFSRWLDYHVDGVRVDSEAISRLVTRLLHWGCRISDKHLPLFEEISLTPTYSCARRLMHLKV
jgi:hypothetical protein